MNVLSAALRQTAADLDRHKRTWALVGGFAVSARAEPRFTRDVDIAVAVEGDADSKDLVRSLLSDGYELFASSPSSSWHVTTKRGRRITPTYGRSAPQRHRKT